jgi:integrase
MASLQQRSGWFHLLFRFDGRQFSNALKTRDRREADAIRGTVDRVLIRVRNKEIPPPPPDADVTAYLLAGGKVVEETRSATPVLTLSELRDRYIQTHGNGALEPKTLVMLRIHFTHLIRHFGERKVVAQFTTGLLQEYVDARSRQKGKQQRPISPVTVQKDLATLRAAWNWAVRSGLLSGTFPGRSLIYPKTDEKPGFQTREEIERKIARGGLSSDEIKDLRACLFLSKPDLTELLDFAKGAAHEPYLFPMVAFAAHTGARRSELIRMRIDDVDLEAGSAVIRERKRIRGQRSTRRVPISGFLKDIIKEWLGRHPGGQLMFCLTRDAEKLPKPITPMIAYEHFRRLVRGSKWDVLRGWHVLRHSFISICAADSVDQRVLQGWVGHLSAATHKRYTHLIPSREQQIIRGVFG